MRYDSDILYRPPGEWKSYLLQCTIGCSYNKCTFCAMYKEKKFRIRPVKEILEDIDMARDYYGPGLKRVFLMDGDAVIMKTDDLIRVLRKLYDTFPALEKVTTYAGPRSTLAKSPEELKAIRDAGLNRAYLGVESGSDAVLKAINKGVTAAQMLEAGQKLVAAGFDLWAIVIMGLTGQDGDWEEHILSTAKMINAMKPRHLSAMTFAPAKAPPWERMCWLDGSRCALRTRFWRSATCWWKIWTWILSTLPATTPPTTCRSRAACLRIGRSFWTCWTRRLRVRSVCAVP